MDILVVAFGTVVILGIIHKFIFSLSNFYDFYNGLWQKRNKTDQGSKIDSVKSDTTEIKSDLKKLHVSTIREKANVLDEGIMKNLKIRANEVKKHIDEMDYISFEGGAIKATLKFNKNEFVDILDNSKIFMLKDNKISLIYQKDPILRSHTNIIIQNLENFQNEVSKLKNLIENLNESNLPSKFEANLRTFLINEFGKDKLERGARLKEFLFILYVVSISGSQNSYQSGRIFIIDIIKQRYDNLQYIAMSDLKSKERYSIIKKSLNNILSCLNNLIEEIESLHEEWINL
ncbi:MAG: hypothetical protein KAT05_10035 [Spirochaetes bacterium]|nr:hypothetical protein [Spirochaetota bacterium]